MNENIDLTKILKNCPRGWKFYSLIYGEVEFDTIINDDTYPIIFITKNNSTISVMSNGRHVEIFDGECTLFPSKEQRDWSKFSAPWYKKEKFDPKTLKPFDKVLVRDSMLVEDSPSCLWRCQIFSSYKEEYENYPYICINDEYSFCIPYNDDTKHLAGTNKEAPEFYKYWEE